MFKFVKVMKSTIEYPRNVMEQYLFVHLGQFTIVVKCDADVLKEIIIDMIKLLLHAQKLVNRINIMILFKQSVSVCDYHIYV